jgi:hypothetical protein
VWDICASRFLFSVSAVLHTHISIIDVQMWTRDAYRDWTRAVASSIAEGGLLRLLLDIQRASVSNWDLPSLFQVARSESMARHRVRSHRSCLTGYNGPPRNMPRKLWSRDMAKENVFTLVFEESNVKAQHRGQPQIPVRG